MAPTKSILDRGFKYVPAAATNLKATFARVRREQAKNRTSLPAKPAEERAA